MGLPPCLVLTVVTMGSDTLGVATQQPLCHDKDANNTVLNQSIRFMDHKAGRGCCNSLRNTV
ncbi:hypothetical protein C5B78_21525 [Aeromonas salmonicida]|nr:hypothetical protein C5B78_21525 [Aeromonas salmonicida]